MEFNRIVWCVYHEYREEIEEYCIWHCPVFRIYATEDLAKKFVHAQPYTEDEHYTCGPMEVREE